MGFLDRLHDIVTATGGALEAPVGFVKDTAQALPELGSLDLPDFAHDVYHALIDRSGQEITSLAGPSGVGGSLIGALPDPVRQGIGAVTTPVQEGMDLAYHDLVGKPLATAVTAATFAKTDGIDALLKPKTYAESWNIAEHRSPGQSLALAFLTHDIRDPAQVKKAQGTDFYGAISGVTDAVSRTFLDPTALALGAASDAAKAARAVDSAADIERLTANGAVAKFAQHVSDIVDANGDGAAGVIRHELFPRHELGAHISDVLANAHSLPPGMVDGLSGPAAVERVTRVLMGATDEIGMIDSTRPDLAGQLSRLSERKSALKALSLNGTALASSPEEMASIDRELNVLHSQQTRLDRLDQLTASVRSLPRTGGAVAARGRFTLGDFYQTSVFAKPLHVAFSMEPHPWIHLDDPASDISVWRMLGKSELPLDDQLAWRSRYMAAGTPAARLAVATAAEDASVASIATKAGMSTDELKGVLAEASRGRGLAKQALDSRAYDGEGRSVISIEGDNGISHKIVKMDAPLYETQLPNLAPIVDMDRVKDAINPIKTFLARHAAYEVPQEMLQQFASVWKPAVLLRVGFPLRFLTDEALRSMSKIGALATMKNIGRGGADAVGSVLERVGFSPKEIDGLTIGGHQFEGAFGAPGDGASIYKKLIQAREAFGTLISPDEGKMLDQLIESGPWRSVVPTEAAYPAAWEHAVNNQIGKSALGSKLLERMQLEAPSQRVEEFASPALREAFGGAPATVDNTVDHVVDWLKNDPAGQKVAAALPIRKDLDAWVRAAHDQIDAYLPTSELKAGAWQGSATHDELVAHLPNASDRPIVHGGVAQEAMGGPIGKAWRGIVDKGMNNLVGKPSNILIRNPFFDHMYQAELSRQVGLLTGETQASLPQRMLHFLTGGETHAAGNAIDLTGDDIARMEYRARRYATTQTKDLFHNFAEEFSFARNLGMLAPFSNAWGQIMSRWAGVAIDNPAFVRRLQIIWRSPERAGLVTDGAGNVLNQDGKIATPIPNSQYKVGGDPADGQRNVTLHLPTWAKDIPGFKNVGDLKFGKDSLNLIMHGLPPVGPLVQVGMNEIAKQRPDLESSLKWALPYGVTQNSLDILKPTIVRRLQTTNEGDANRSYAYTAMRIYTDKMVDYNLGKRSKQPTWAEAEADAHSFWHMRTIASFTLPVTPQFTSPYQPYIDAYRARRDLDGKLTAAQKALPSYKTPDEWFLDTYGQEFFPIVASMSKSIDGIPPTLEGQKVHDQYAGLIQKYPELGSLIAGADGAGAFSRAVYEAQFGQKIGPGTSQAERTVQPFDQFRTQASTKLGWIEYSRIMDQLDAVRVQRGLPSMQVQGASDLLRAKQAAVAVLANDPRYAGWYQDYASTDPTKWDQRIAGMTAIADDKRLSARPEFQGLKQYLEGRAAIVNTLNTLNKKNLNTQATSALQAGWEAYIGHLVDSNPAFGALYNRWLANDPVIVTPITVAAQTGQLSPPGL